MCMMQYQSMRRANMETSNRCHVELKPESNNKNGKILTCPSTFSGINIYNMRYTSTVASSGDPRMSHQLNRSFEKQPAAPPEFIRRTPFCVDAKEDEVPRCAYLFIYTFVVVLSICVYAIRTTQYVHRYTNHVKYMCVRLNCPTLRICATMEYVLVHMCLRANWKR